MVKEGPECVYITYSTARACMAGSQTCGELGGGGRNRETDVPFEQNRAESFCLLHCFLPLALTVNVFVRRLKEPLMKITFQ